jgi:ketosteroid isomerase-like protein
MKIVALDGPIEPVQGKPVNKAARRIFIFLAILAAPLAAASPEDEVRQTFERFVTAQNTHDIQAVRNTLVDSADFLWVTRGAAVWGRETALKRFSALYEGTWQLAPEVGALKVILLGDGTAQVFVPIVFTIGAAGQTPQTTRFLMNQILVKTRDGWKVSSLLPVPAPAP